MNATSGRAPTSTTTPIKISTAIAMKKAKMGLIRTATAIAENFAQVRNWSMAGRPRRADAGNTGHVIANRWFIDVPFSFSETP
jgi:hypothetical protein